MSMVAAPDARDDAATLIEAIPDAVIGLTPRGVVRTWNPGAQRLFGCAPAQAIGKTLSSFADPAHRDAVANLIQAPDTTAVTGPVEILFLRRNQMRVPMEVTLAITRRPDGQVVSLVGLVRDISARKAADANTTLIVEELNHRIKNALATVHAIVAQSLRGATSLDEFKIAIGGRLSALAATHDLVTRRECKCATLSELIHSELAPYGDTAAARWHMSGPHVSFEPRRALVMSMMIHELATNAAKYGALSTPEGRVDVTWQTHETQGRLTLEWRESGGPPVATPSRRGFGTRLITEALAMQLAGNVALVFDRDGVRCAIDVPVDFCGGDEQHHDK